VNLPSVVCAEREGSTRRGVGVVGDCSADNPETRLSLGAHTHKHRED
jgi:hypothetical protein